MRRNIFLLIASTLFAIIYISPLSAQSRPTTCSGFLPSRLIVGGRARVLSGLPNRIRDVPSLDSEQLGEIPSGSVFNVLEGPTCDASNASAWWRINYNGVTGWTAEGQGNEYWLEPTRIPITPDTAAQIEQIGALGRANIHSVEWPSDGIIIVDSSSGVWQLDAKNLHAPANLNLDEPVVDTSPLQAQINNNNFTVAIIDAATNSRQFVVSGHEDEIRSTDFNPDYTLLATGSLDGTVRLWDTLTGEQLALLEGGVVVRFSPDGNLLTFAGRDEAGIVTHIWDVTNNAEVAELRGGSPEHFSPDGNILLALRYDRDLGATILLWDLARRPLADSTPIMLDTHFGNLTDVDFSPDNKLVVTATHDYFAELDNAIRVWDTDTGALIYTFEVSDVWDVAFSPDGTRIVGGNTSGELRLWDVSSGEELVKLSGSGSVRELLFSTDGRLLASRDGFARLWDSESGNEKVIGADSDDLFGTVDLALIPDSSILAILDHKGQLRLFDTRTAQEALVMSVNGATGLAVSPDGTRLALANGSEGLEIWEVATRLRGEQNDLITWEHSPNIVDMAFSPDGTMLATASFDGPVQLWPLSEDIRPTVEWLDFSETERSSSVAFSPDGQLLATAQTVPGKVIIWSLEAGQPMMSLEEEVDDYGFGYYYTNDIAFNPTGDILAVASSDSIRLWDTATGNLLTTLPAGPESIWSVSFSPDGTLLATGSGGVNEGAFEAYSVDSFIRLWGIPASP